MAKSEVEKAMARWHKLQRELSDLMSPKGLSVPNRDARIVQLKAALVELEPVRCEYVKRFFRTPKLGE